MRALVFPLIFLASLSLALTAAVPVEKSQAPKGPQLTVTDVQAMGVVVFPTGQQFAGTEVGGLSGITYDASRGVYYALSDDRSQINDARYYTLDIDLSDGYLDPGDVIFLDVTFLQDKRGGAFPLGSLDPEGIELLNPGQMFISSEGDANSDPVIDPFVNRFNPTGRENRALPVPFKFLPDGAETFGIRDNLAFESLTSTPNRRYLYTASENALHQDGPRTSLTDSSPSRVLEYNLMGKRPGREFVYVVDPIPQAPVPPGSFADNGLVELQALDNHGTFLAMERSFAVGVGNTVVLFETSTQGATDVSDDDSLSAGMYVPMAKRQVADLEADLGVTPDNLEGMAFGPPLPDGRLPLIVISDNNFNPDQTTQFILLAVELTPVGSP
jgi:3-phytase/alkaline phosphatase D